MSQNSFPNLRHSHQIYTYNGRASFRFSKTFSKEFLQLCRTYKHFIVILTNRVADQEFTQRGTIDTRARVARAVPGHYTGTACHSEIPSACYSCSGRLVFAGGLGSSKLARVAFLSYVAHGMGVFVFGDCCSKIKKALFGFSNTVNVVNLQTLDQFLFPCNDDGIQWLLVICGAQS